MPTPFEQMDRSAAMVLLVAFAFAALVTWTFRVRLAQSPLIGYVFGVALCVAAGIIAICVPQSFQLQGLIATALLVGMGLLLMDGALSRVSSHSGVMAELAREYQRLDAAEAANDERSTQLLQLKGQRMAELHKLLRVAEINADLSAGIEREIAIRHKIDRLMDLAKTGEAPQHSP